jgi:hypothetical protein
MSSKPPAANSEPAYRHAHETSLPRLNPFGPNRAAHPPSSSDTCSAFVKSISVATPTSLLAGKDVSAAVRRLPAGIETLTVSNSTRSGPLDRSWLRHPAQAEAGLEAGYRATGGRSRRLDRSERQREATPRLRRSVPAARSCVAQGWIETSIEPFTPLGASVDRLREVDYLTHVLGDL